MCLYQVRVTRTWKKACEDSSQTCRTVDVNWSTAIQRSNNSILRDSADDGRQLRPNCALQTMGRKLPGQIDSSKYPTQTDSIPVPNHMQCQTPTLTVTNIPYPNKREKRDGQPPSHAESSTLPPSSLHLKPLLAPKLAAIPLPHILATKLPKPLVALSSFLRR